VTLTSDIEAIRTGLADRAPSDHDEIRALGEALRDLQERLRTRGYAASKSGPSFRTELTRGDAASANIGSAE
jgi:hypothetical protein